MRWTEGDVIRKLRAVTGWTLEDLAEASGVNLQVIHKLEAGKTKEAKRATLTKIGAAFGLTEHQIRLAIPQVIELPIRVREKETKGRRMSAGS